MIQNLTVDDKNFLTGIAKKIIELKIRKLLITLKLWKQLLNLRKQIKKFFYLNRFTY